MLKNSRSPSRTVGTPTPGHWVPPRSSPFVISLSSSWRVGLLVCLAVFVLVSRLDGGAVVELALSSCFDVLCTHTSLDDKGRGEVQDGVGWPHSRGLSWPTFWLISCSESSLRFLASFTFVFASVGRQRRGGGYPWHLVERPGRFHCST